ncbi:hypothetical protein Tco_0332979 [Tanacetum coccineum]
MDIDIEEDKNKPELMFPYEEADPLNPPPPTSDSEPEAVIEVEDTVEPEDEIVPASVYEIASISRQLCGHETTHALVKKKGKAKDEYYGKLILDLGNKVLSRMEEGTTAIENLVRKLGNAEERVECKKLKKELEEERIMHPKSSPLTQSAVRQMIKESVDAAIATEQARDANARNNASRSGQARGAVELRRWFEKMEMTFGIRECAEDKKVKIEKEFWNLKVKEYNKVAYTQRFNELALMCLRMVELKSVKVYSYIRGLSDNIKGEVTSSKPTNLNEAMRMAHKLME